MSDLDRELRRQVDEALDAMGATGGRAYFDRAAPAVYRLAPAGQEATALACLGCRTVTIKPGAPRGPAPVLTCANCGTPWQLDPPAEVRAFGDTGLVVAGQLAPDSRIH